jgi:hypothetical protein
MANYNNLAKTFIPSAEKLWKYEENTTLNSVNNKRTVGGRSGISYNNLFYII